MNKSEWLDVSVVVACAVNIVAAVCEKRFHDAFVVSMLACVYGKQLQWKP